MINESINARLLHEMRKHVENQSDMLPIVMDILSLGKEAVYRRFRGDVPFTLQEAMTISRRMGISLDKLSGTIPDSMMLMDWTQESYSEPTDLYSESLLYYSSLLKDYTEESGSEQWDASSKLPLPLSMGTPALGKFHLMRWLSQMDNSGRICPTYDELEYGQEIFEKQKKFSEMLQSFDKSLFIWDETLFISLVNDVKYFREIGLMNEENVSRVKDEMLKLIDKVEVMAGTGVFSSGKNIEVYLSSINLESSYAYFLNDHRKVSILKLYGLNTIVSHDEHVFQAIRKKINTLKKSSTLITNSAQMVRVNYFRQQREYIETL